MLTPAISMLVSESLLSLYPIFVKKIGLTLVHQVWVRLVAYVGISAIFVNWSFIGSSLFTADALILAAINLSHIFFSYEGFRNLDSGVSFAIFNTYPLMILLIAGVMWNNVYLLVLLGLALFVLGESAPERGATDKERSSTGPEGSKAAPFGTKERSTTEGPKATPFRTEGTKERSTTEERKEEGTKEKPDFTYGIAMVLLAALTEALIYFMVRRIKTDNHWNHVFLSYFVGFIAFTGYLLVKGTDLPISKTTLPRMGLAVGLNGFIGAVAYFLRFFAASNLAASIFAPLAYFGMVMSYVYGIVFNQETLSWEKVGGTLCILAANYLSPKS
jgi:drug/metabolite transporter (DMT)-like permease